MTTTPIRVLLADDHTLVRAGIRALLEKVPDVVVAGEAGDGREALALVASQQPDIVLMDIAMPGLNGLEATSRIQKDHPNVRVIILSMHQNEEYYWQAMRAGASGYLLKKAAAAELQTAISQVNAGEVYLSRELSDRLAQQPALDAGQGKTPLESLTGRQREILQLIAEGQNTKSIGYMLNLSPKTVEYHRAQLMARLHIHDVPGLVRFAIKVGLVSQES